MKTLIIVLSKTLNILFKIIKTLIKTLFNISNWIYTNKQKSKIGFVYTTSIVIIVWVTLAIATHATPFVEECNGGKGDSTIAENSFMAKYLVKKCEDRKIEEKNIIFPEGYNSPKDLFYAFLKEDQSYVTQTFKQHFANNGYLAIDIATGGRRLGVYAPSYMYLDDEGLVHDDEVEYIANTIINQDTTGLTLVLRIKDTNKAFMIGHMDSIYVKDGETVKTGDNIGLSGGCPDNPMYGEKTTGCHIHLEYRVENNPVPYPEFLYSNHNDNLDKYRLYKESKKQEYKEEHGIALYEDNDIYKEFGGDYKMLPFILSAQHLRESERCINDCPVSNAGARGAMQFMKNTWYEYGCDGNNDGVIDVENLQDSMCGASNYMTYLFEEKGRGQNPTLNWVWQWWKTLYIYNAGYSAEPTHEDGLKQGVDYADAIMNLSLELQKLNK